MNWKVWKMGLVVAAITGAAMAFLTAAIDPGLSRQAFWTVLAVGAIKDGLLFLKDHPVEKIEWGNLQAWVIGALVLPGCLVLAGCAVTRTNQKDAFYDKEGRRNQRQTTTWGVSVWDALAKLGGFRATQSDRTQTMAIASQSSESSASNVVTIAGEAAALGKLLAPVPIPK